MPPSACHSCVWRDLLFVIARKVVVSDACELVYLGTVGTDPQLLHHYLLSLLEVLKGFAVAV